MTDWRFPYPKLLRQAWGLVLNSILVKKLGLKVSQQNKWKETGTDENKYTL